MQESATNMGVFGFWIFLAVVVVGGIWAHTRRLQIRKDLIQSMLDKGQPVDVQEVNRLLNPWSTGHENFNAGPRDPRSSGRAASFIFFIAGFATLFVAFQHEPRYLLALLGILPLFLAVAVWHTVNREFADGTLATLHHVRDPREPWQHGGGLFFWIGYATIFMAIARYELNLPLIALGLAAIFIAFGIWRDGERQYAAGKIPVHAPDSDDKVE